MIGYLLFSHGSLLCGAGQALDMHTLLLRERLAPSPVEEGYLNYTEPDVAVAVDRLARAGVSAIVVVPYFLVPGYFVTTSLPKRLAEIAPDYPNIEFRIADALGVDRRLADAVTGSLSTAREPRAESDEVIASAAAACRLLATCPFYGGEHCPGTVGLRPEPRAPRVVRSEFAPDELSKTALLVMIHGSPKESANQLMLDVLEIIRAQKIFAFVQPGFMECNSPTIPDAADICAAQGVERIIAVPYFLHLGTHVADDLPNQLIESQLKHPSLSILMTDYLGQSELLTDVLFDRAKAVLLSTC